MDWGPRARDDHVGARQIDLSEATRRGSAPARGRDVRHEHGDNVVEGKTLWEKLRNPELRVLVAQNVSMDWSMLRNDLLIGFVLAD